MIDVQGLDEVRAAALLWGRLDDPTRKAVRKQSQAWAPSLIQSAVRHAHSKPQGAVAVSGKTTITDKGLVAVFGSSGTLHGTPLRRIAPQYEFGTNDRDHTTTYVSRHRITKKSMRVTRRTRRQLPHRRATGWFLYPAVAEETPELVSRWVRAIARAAEGD